MSTIPERIINRFRGLLAPAAARTVLKPMPAPAQPTEAEVLHAQLHRWVAAAPPDFDAHLADTVEAAHENAERTRAAHSETNYWLGYERAIRDVRLAFTQWSQPDAGKPAPTADLQGGLDARS